MRFLTSTTRGAVLAAATVLAATALGAVGAQTSSAATHAKASSRISAIINFEITEEPCAFAGVDPLRERYKGLGVHFTGPAALDGAAILDECSNFAVDARSGEAFLAVGEGIPLANGGSADGPITIRFDRKQRAVGIWLSSSSNSTESFKLIGKRGGKVIRSQTLTTDVPDWQPLKVKSKGGFTSVVIRDVSSDGFWLVDDLSIVSL